MARTTFSKHTRKYLRNSHCQKRQNSTRSKTRGSGKITKFMKGAWSMKEYWKTIENRLKELGDDFKCVMCKEKLPSTFEYKTVMSWFGVSSFRAKTDDTKLVVRKFNLPSALRSEVNASVDVSGHDFGGSIQPTIFYFHCPYCAYIHIYKSSVKLFKPPTSRSRSSTRNSTRNSIRRRTQSTPLVSQ